MSSFSQSLVDASSESEPIELKLGGTNAAIHSPSNSVSLSQIIVDGGLQTKPSLLLPFLQIMPPSATLVIIA
jgi:hypothetical protein